MPEYSAGIMTAFPWATPNVDPVYTLTADGNPTSTGLGDPHFAIDIEWDWPTQHYWSHFTIIRSIRSPARRTEEGQWMFDRPQKQETYSSIRWDTGRPYYTDPQPPPGEWTYYTLFVLDVNRVWHPAGSVFEIGPADYNWTLNLPELIPGTSVNVEQGVAHPADQASDLVQFLQGPGTYTDIAVTMAESMQYFWDPIRVPPQNFQHLARSWGYDYANALGLIRERDTLNALRKPSQGSLTAVQRVVEGASGCDSVVRISDNLMMNPNDSSFESGKINDTGWEPSNALEVWDYLGHVNDPAQPIAPPNIMFSYFLYVPTARTIKCGFRTVINPEDGTITREFDPFGVGIPVASWTKIRMGCYGYARTVSSTKITMGMDFYDKYGNFIDDLVVLPAEDLDYNTWDWHGNGYKEAAAVKDVDISFPPFDLTDPVALVDPTKWKVADGYSGPQTTNPPTTAAGAIVLKWEAAPTVDTGFAFYGMETFQTYLYESWVYQITATVNAPSGAADWRIVVAGQDGSTARVTPDGTPKQATFTWTGTSAKPHIGIEVTKPVAGWASANTHTVTQFKVERMSAEHAYGVPWITMSNACCIDLIVVDDG